MAHQPADKPADEVTRIAALERLHVLDTLPELPYDDIVSLAKTICGTPIALVSLVDRDRQWFKACIGLPVRETHRDAAFCAHAILRPDQLTLIEDATKDVRFKENPLVTGGPGIRFYAGAPIVTSRGSALGTVCVIDTKPNTLSDQQRDALLSLARQTACLFELREFSIQRDDLEKQLRSKVVKALVDDDVDLGPLQQRQRVASIGELTSGVAHDFNNLLQAISVNFQLIQRRTDRPDLVARWSGEGLRSVERGAKLVAQILSFSRDRSPELKPVYVSERISEMRDLLARVIGPSVRLHFDLEPKPVPVLCDDTQLEAALMNMVVNSRDAMNNSGEITVSTSLKISNCDPAVPEGLYLELRVSDNGPGMAYSIASKVFEPFFTTKEEGKGTGLGLSQVQGFAMKAGGGARVETMLGKGTSVVLLLKPTMESADSLLPIAVQPIAQAPAGDTDILLVDDNSDVNQRMAELLREAGYGVRSVASGAAAISAVEDVRPQLVVSDFEMRRLGGSLLATVLHQIEPALPIIFITGSGDIDSVRSQLPSSAIVLQKPFDVEVLLNHIVTVLEN